MRRLYAWAGGRKVFQAYLFVVLVLGLLAFYVFALGDPPDFRWVVSPLAAALIGTGFAVAWEDRGSTVRQLADRWGGAAAPKGSEEPEPGER